VNVRLDALGVNSECRVLPESRPQHARRRLAPRPLAPLGLVGALAAVAVGIVLALSLRGGAAQPPSAAAVVLARAAHAAEASAGPRRLRPGEYGYVKSIWTNTRRPARKPQRARIGHDRQRAVDIRAPGVDRPRPARTGREPCRRGATFLSAAARQQWIRAGRPRVQRVAAANFTEIGDLLREDPIPAKVRAALYLVAARIPGIHVLGLTRDGIGRPALAVALNDTLYGERSELLFDPTTSRLLGERSVVVKPPPAYHVKPGSVQYGATHVTSGIVERLGQVPKG
jgi:hypothetical protein